MLVIMIKKINLCNKKLFNIIHFFLNKFPISYPHSITATFVYKSIEHLCLEFVYNHPLIFYPTYANKFIQNK